MNKQLSQADKTAEIKLSLENVSFSYGEEKILDGIDLNIEEGSFVCLLGASGCGKSTLLSLLEGINFPDEGHVRIDGRDITSPGLDRSVVFQDYSLFPWLTAGQNVLLAMKQAFKGTPEKDLRKRVDDYFRMVGLEKAYNKLPNELSGGMRQRAAIARAFSIEAPVLLMDEPFGALDAITRSSLQELLLELTTGKNRKRTVVFVTHDVDEALFLASRIVIISGGRIAMDIPVEYGEELKYKDFFFKDERIIALKQQILNYLDDKEKDKFWSYSICSAQSCCSALWS